LSGLVAQVVRVRSPTIREGKLGWFALDDTPREMLARDPALTRGLLTILDAETN